MIKIMKELWGENSEKLRAHLAGRTDLNECEYTDLVKITFDVIFNTDRRDANRYSGIDKSRLDIEHITTIDNGDYQGTLLFVIPFDTYQPSSYEYLMTCVEYGSCACCDTLQGIQTFRKGKLTEQQLDEFMHLCENLICDAIKPYNYGWRHNPDYDPVEVSDV